MNRNVMLVSPNSLGSYRSANINDENLALGYLAAVLEIRGYHTEIIDARMRRLSPQYVAEKIGEARPFMVGISMISEEGVPWVKALGGILGLPEYLRHVCAGGYYPSLQPEAVLEQLVFVDSVAVGEGEATLMELAEKVENSEPWTNVESLVVRSVDGAAVTNNRRLVVYPLDTLPFPKRYADQDSTEIVVEGSRGCFGKCTFCAIGPHLKAGRQFAWRGRSPESIVSEMIQLRRVYPNNKRYRFIDPDFFGSASRIHADRILKLASLIKSHVPGIELYVEARVADLVRRDVLEELKTAGLKEIYLGVESGSKKILDCMGKHASVDDTVRAVRLLDELGINYQYGFMMVTPWTEYEDVIASLTLLRTIGRVQFDKLFNELYIIPGTVLVDSVGQQYQLVKEDGTGYYFYESNELVKNIRAFNVAFETTHRAFSEDLWFLYKDVQRHEQCCVQGATEIQRKLSSLFIDIFEYCLERCKNGLLNPEEISCVSTAAAAHFQAGIQAIKSLLDPSVHFHRCT